MAEIKISELTAASSASGTMEFETNDSGTSKKVTGSQLKTYVNADLGTISTQNANNVNITGGSISGITDLAVADGGTGASTAANARVNLLPSYTGNNGKVLSVNTGATDVEWTSVSFNTPLSVVGNSTSGAEIRLPEDTDNGTNYVSLKAPDSIASNLIFTLPSTDGTTGQVLQTNGSGSLSWINRDTYNITYLIVGGGGSGGGNSTTNAASGGGGGGGGVATGIATLVKGDSYTITVGAGGSGTAGAGNSGIASSFGSEFVVIGGGRGGSYDSKDGENGGSGGGGAGRAATETNTPGRRSVFSGGYGGQGFSVSGGSGVSGGGGGGSGGNGYWGSGSGSSGVGGVGGDGAVSDITGTQTYYGGGGGGGSRTTGGAGGNGGGGGGRSGNGNGTNATANTGGGGGGGSNSGATFTGGNGGSGVVILRILTTNYSSTTTGSPTVTTDGSYTVLTFTSSGSYTA